MPDVRPRLVAIRRRKLESELRTRKRTPTDRDRLKAALEQRAKEWKRELRGEPRIARLVLRRLVAPIVLHDESKRPAFVEWEAQPTVGLLDGLAPPIWLASLMPASWNQITEWLRLLEGLRHAS